MKKEAMLVLITSLLLISSCSQSSPPSAQPSGQTPAINNNGNDYQPPQQQASVPISSGKVVSVTIKEFKFSPADVAVKVGDTVVWTNQDSAPHTVESSDGTLKSDELSKGDTYKFTFTKAGTYAYHCGIHASMRGSITVQ